MPVEVKNEQINDSVLVKQLRKRVRELTSILKGKEKREQHMECRLREYKTKMAQLRNENERLNESNQKLAALITEKLQK